MRVTLTVDGSSRSVEVDLPGGTVTLDGVVHPVKVVDAGGERVQLEIDGESVTIEGWPKGLEQPLKDLAVNGERVTARIDSRGSVGSTTRRPNSEFPTAARPDPPPSLSSADPAGPGAVIRPPMPGKVIEVRVRDGDRVVAGQVVLVLEAMKMRNDVISPSPGTVRDLRVSAGANVRAREAMLRIAPTDGG